MSFDSPKHAELGPCEHNVHNPGAVGSSQLFVVNGKEDYPLNDSSTPEPRAAESKPEAALDDSKAAEDIDGILDLWFLQWVREYDVKNTGAVVQQLDVLRAHGPRITRQERVDMDERSIKLENPSTRHRIGAESSVRVKAHTEGTVQHAPNRHNDRRHLRIRIEEVVSAH